MWSSRPVGTRPVPRTSCACRGPASTDSSASARSASSRRDARAGPLCPSTPDSRGGFPALVSGTSAPGDSRVPGDSARLRGGLAHPLRRALRRADSAGTLERNAGGDQLGNLAALGRAPLRSLRFLAEDELTQAALPQPEGSTPAPDKSLIAMDLETGAERVLMENWEGLRDSPMSPDGRVFALFQRDPDSGVERLSVLTLADGSRRELLRLSDDEWGSGLDRTPDGSTLLFSTWSGDAGPRESWRVPVSGGDRRLIEGDPNLRGSFSIHPSGNRVALQAGQHRTAARCGRGLGKRQIRRLSGEVRPGLESSACSRSSAKADGAQQRTRRSMPARSSPARCVATALRRT